MAAAGPQEVELRDIKLAIDDVDLSAVLSLRQPGTLCWAQATFVALFLSPTIRSYVWSRLFFIKEHDGIYYPTGTKFPPLDHVPIDLLQKYIIEMGLSKLFTQTVDSLTSDKRPTTIKNFIKDMFQYI